PRRVLPAIEDCPKTPAPSASPKRFSSDSPPGSPSWTHPPLKPFGKRASPPEILCFADETHPLPRASAPSLHLFIGLKQKALRRFPLGTCRERLLSLRCDAIRAWCRSDRTRPHGGRRNPRHPPQFVTMIIPGGEQIGKG